jgi:hypothetical protein
VKVWDAHTGQELLSLQGGGDNVAFSPDADPYPVYHRLRAADPVHRDAASCCKGRMRSDDTTELRSTTATSS